MSSEPTVFLSYSREALPHAMQLARILVDLGANVWLDRDRIAPADDWVSSIEKALTESDLILLLVSSDYRQESFANYERALALKLAQERKATVIPVLLPGSTFDDVPPSLLRFNAIDATQGISSAVGAFGRALRAA